MNQTELPKNLLFKWIGGKKWLTKTLKEQIETINLSNKKTYIEPFIGGMGAFFALFETLKKNGISHFILNDINEIIILTYNTVKQEPEKIIPILRKLEEDYEKSIIDKEVHKLNKTNDKIKVKELLKGAELFFRKVKKDFNIIKMKKRTRKENYEIVAIFLFLQDHSFNGVYRENNSGEYNTPFNWDPKIYNIPNKINTINQYSKFFNENNIEFTNLDVFDLLKKTSNENKPFIYLDPPYLNEDEKSENQYNKDHFGKKEQNKLLDLLEDYDTFMYSNHFLPLFKEYFNKINHRYKSIPRKNIMTAKKENRGNDILEILGIKENKNGN